MVTITRPNCGRDYRKAEDLHFSCLVQTNQCLNISPHSKSCHGKDISTSISQFIAYAGHYQKISFKSHASLVGNIPCTLPR